MGKNQNKPAVTSTAAARKSRAPRHRGINSPKNVHKGFRSHGSFNSMVVKSVLGQ